MCENLLSASLLVRNPTPRRRCDNCQRCSRLGATWSADWAWGLPLIVATLVIHVLGLFLIGKKAERFQKGVGKGDSYAVVFTVIVGGASLSATLLLGIEGIIWAAAYRLVGALPDASSAVLYSLNAMTAYGHVNL